MPILPLCRIPLRLNVILVMRIPRAPNAETDSSRPRRITERIFWIRIVVVCVAPFFAVTFSLTLLALPDTFAEAPFAAGADPPPLPAPGLTPPDFDELELPEPEPPADRLACSL